MRNCLECKRVIPSDAHRLRVYCCKDCQVKANINLKTPRKECIKCGKTLGKVHHNVKHCSVACKNKHYYDKKKETKPELMMLARSKARAKVRGLEHNIEVHDIVIPAVCPVLGLVLIRSEHTPCSSSPSLDRIDSKKGYIKGNVRVVSQRANVLKSNATKKELEAVLNDIRQLEENTSL